MTRIYFLKLLTSMPISLGTPLRAFCWPSIREQKYGMQWSILFGRFRGKIYKFPAKEFIAFFRVIVTLISGWLEFQPAL